MEKLKSNTEKREHLTQGIDQLLQEAIALDEKNIASVLATLLGSLESDNDEELSGLCVEFAKNMRDKMIRAMTPDTAN